MPEENQDVRWKQRFQSFRMAFEQLRIAVETQKSRELSDLEKQGLIKAFEFTHEIAWKTLKDFLEARGQTGIYGSRDATRAAFAAELIRDGDAWMEMIESRNLSSHTYNLFVANKVAASVADSYFQQFEHLAVDMQKLTELQP
jgi:nucleotidyltransferase substrate binding protein (TIGR01987 family)